VPSDAAAVAARVANREAMRPVRGEVGAARGHAARDRARRAWLVRAIEHIIACAPCRSCGAASTEPAPRRNAEVLITEVLIADQGRAGSWPRLAATSEPAQADPSPQRRRLHPESLGRLYDAPGVSERYELHGGPLELGPRVGGVPDDPSAIRVGEVGLKGAQRRDGIARELVDDPR
jgi:hypothetical protein